MALPHVAQPPATRAVERLTEFSFDRLQMFAVREPHGVAQPRPLLGASREVVEDGRHDVDRALHQSLIGDQSHEVGLPLGHDLIGDELLGIGWQRALEQKVVERHAAQRAAAERVVGRLVVVLAVPIERRGLVERIAIDQHGSLAALLRRPFERRNANARVEIRRKLDRRVAIVQPLVEIVVAGHVERRLPPPVDLAGHGGEARADGMADEQVVDRHGAADVEQRPALEATEVERRTRRIADRPAGQSVVDPTAAIEMGEEGNRVAEEPRSRPGDRGEDGKTFHCTHLTDTHLAVPVSPHCRLINVTIAKLLVDIMCRV